jgi:hypothetical protein
VAHQADAWTIFRVFVHLLPSILAVTIPMAFLLGVLGALSVVAIFVSRWASFVSLNLNAGQPAATFLRFEVTVAENLLDKPQDGRLLIVLGRSGKVSLAEEAREIGLAWEQLPDPRPPFNLEIFTPGGQREFFLLGPHAPNLTSNEVRLVHRLWLRFSDLVSPGELHHHDVVHFALDEVMKELEDGKEADPHLFVRRTKR